MTENNEDIMQLQDTQEDGNMSAVISLPSSVDMTDSKVLSSVKSVFGGFDRLGHTRFSDIETLASYALCTIESIKQVRMAADTEQLERKAAAMARFWYLGETLDNALKGDTYGTAAVNRLAIALKVSVPYVYQIRAVAVKLTAVDCYLLGMRGMDSTHLRMLTRIKDDTTRRAVIDTFISMVKDTSDEDLLRDAKKKLVAAVNTNQAITPEDLVSTDPMQSQQTSVTPEYDAAIKQLTDWLRMLKKPASEKCVNDICTVLAEFYLMQNVPEAEARLDYVKLHAEELMSTINALRINLDDIQRELESVAEMELTSCVSEVS